MKRVLIISYHALPMDVVSSYRVKAYADYFLHYNLKPTILTHRWERDDNGGWRFHDDDQVVTEEAPTATVIRLPRKQATVTQNQLGTLINYLKGDFEPGLRESYATFKKFLFRHLREHHYDLLLVVFSPHYHLKLGREVKSAFGIPYVADFRDLWDNQVITRSYRPGLKKRLIDLIIRKWWTEWISHALFFTTTGERWCEYLENMTGKKGYVVRNGFDGAVHSNTVSTPSFNIVHFGRFYPDQVPGVFLNGFNLFLAAHAGEKIKLLIIGAKPTHGIQIGVHLKEIDPRHYEERPYMTREDLDTMCQTEATVFWMPGFKEDNGSFAVKVYDYMKFRRQVLFAPDDGSEIGRVLVGSQSGVVKNSAAEVADQLGQWFNAWKQWGYVPCASDEGVINTYSRARQVKVMADKIHEYLD